jgi:hypothetical protein
MAKGEKKRGRPKKVQTNKEEVERLKAENQLPEPQEQEPQKIELAELENVPKNKVFVAKMRIIDHNGEFRDVGDRFVIEDKKVVKQLKDKGMIE